MHRRIARYCQICTNRGRIWSQSTVVGVVLRQVHAIWGHKEVKCAAMHWAVAAPVFHSLCSAFVQIPVKASFSGYCSIIK